MCFHYDKVDHKRSDYPRLMSGAVRELTPTTLKITYGPEGRTKGAMGRS